MENGKWKVDAIGQILIRDNNNFQFSIINFQLDMQIKIL